MQIQPANYWATLPPLKRKDRSADLKGNKKSNERIDKSGNGLGERGRYSTNKKKRERERESNCFIMTYIDSSTRNVYKFTINLNFKA